MSTRSFAKSIYADLLYLQLLNLKFSLKICEFVSVQVWINKTRPRIGSMTGGSTPQKKRSNPDRRNYTN